MLESHLRCHLRTQAEFAGILLETYYHPCTGISPRLWYPQTCPLKATTRTRKQWEPNWRQETDKHIRDTTRPLAHHSHCTTRAEAKGGSVTPHGKGNTRWSLHVNLAPPLRGICHLSFSRKALSLRVPCVPLPSRYSTGDGGGVTVLGRSSRSWGSSKINAYAGHFRL